MTVSEFDRRRRRLDVKWLAEAEPAHPRQTAGWAALADQVLETLDVRYVRLLIEGGARADHLARELARLTDHRYRDPMVRLALRPEVLDALLGHPGSRLAACRGCRLALPFMNLPLPGPRGVPAWQTVRLLSGCPECGAAPPGRDHPDLGA